MPVRPASPRVADEPGAPSGQRDGPVAGQLEPAQGAELQQVADPETVGTRVESGVEGQAPRVEATEERRVGHLVDQAPKGEVLRERGHDQTLPYPTSLVTA